MSVIKFDEYGIAFVLPDDLEPFMRRYGVDVLVLNAEEGSIAGIGPNDKDWREIPSELESGARVSKLRSVD